MSPSETHGLKSYISRSVIFLVATTTGFVLASIAILINQTPELVKFQFNPYAILSGLSALVSVALLWALILRRGYIQARIWFSIEIIGVVLVCLGEVAVRISTTAPQVMFWSHLTYIGVAMIPVGLYMFVYYFVNDSTKATDIMAPTSLTIGSGLLLFLTSGNASPELIKSVQGFWGFSIPLTPSFVALVSWLSIVISACIYKLILYHRRAKTAAQRHQIELIISGAILSLTGGVLLDVLPRTLGWQIFPIGVLTQLFMPAFVIYAIYKYDAFGFELTADGNDILNTLTEAVIVTDKKFKIVSINNYGLTLTGYSNAKLIGRPLNRLFEPSKFRTISNTLTHAPKKQPTTVFNDIEINNSQGTKVTVNLTVSELRSEPAYVFVLANITELKEFYESEQERNKLLEASNKAYVDQQLAIMNLLEDARDLEEQLRHEKADVERKVEQRTAEVKAERSRLKASINSLNIGLLIIDNDMKTVNANKALRSILYSDQPPKAITVSKLDKQFGAGFKLKKSIDQCLTKGETITKDNILFDTRVLRIFIAPYIDGNRPDGLVGAVVLIEDVSEVKAAERSRDEFFSIASHELRTPLTAIRGNTQMILDYYSDKFKDPILSEMVEDIHDSSIRLITIVNDFLDTSRLEQGKINFKIGDFDINDLVNEIAKEFKVGAFNPDLYIKIDRPVKLPLVLADRDRLKQTIINLIGNAFKFTAEGGVTVTLRANAKKMVVDIADTGKGIPKESQNLLFRKFQQASNNILTRDSTRSTGLGLYISKLLIEGMNGEIYLKSTKVGRGSVFTIEIPLSANRATPNK